MPPPTIQADGGDRESRLRSWGPAATRFSRLTADDEEAQISALCEGSEICDPNSQSAACTEKGEHHEPVPATSS